MYAIPNHCNDNLYIDKNIFREDITSYVQRDRNSLYVLNTIKNHKMFKKGVTRAPILGKQKLLNGKYLCLK